jgi:integrase
VVFGQLMNFCRSQGWRESNPAEPITVKVKFKEPEALTPEQARRLLRACRNHQDHALAVPYFAAACLAGLRPGEAEQLAWEDINMGTRQIHVRGETSKTRKPRFVDMEPEAAALLRPYAKRTGAVIGPSLFLWTKLWQDARAAAGWRFVGRKLNVKGKEWPDDVLRHTYATYWLARHHDRQRLVEMMGNSAKVVATHYRRAVPAPEAAAFWRAMGEKK